MYINFKFYLTINFLKLYRTFKKNKFIKNRQTKKIYKYIYVSQQELEKHMYIKNEI